MKHAPLTPYFVLLGGIMIAATSGILVRLAQSEAVPSLVVATWRLIPAVIILTPLAWYRQKAEIKQLRQVDIRWGILAGVLLAAHLAAWISSLAFTSVASAAALVTTNPLWVAIASFFLFGERLSTKTIAGLTVGFVGSVLIAFSDGGVISYNGGSLQFNWQNLLPVEQGNSNMALFGDALALAGALAGAGYLLVGRGLRVRLSNTTYVWLAYGAAMAVMVGVTLLSGYSLLGYSFMAYVWLLLLALGPQLLGHTAFNWALAHLSATFVALSILGEPIGSAILAYIIFDESFAPVQLVGLLLLLAGIALGVLGEQQSRKVK